MAKKENDSKQTSPYDQLGTTEFPSTQLIPTWGMEDGS